MWEEGRIGGRRTNDEPKGDRGEENEREEEGREKGRHRREHSRVAAK